MCAYSPSRGAYLCEGCGSHYSFFESILEACVDSIKFMWVKIRPCGEEMVFCMEVESEDDLNSFFDKTDQGENEDGIWKFTFTIKKAGEK